MYVAGTVSNQGRFYDRFDAVVLLSAPANVLLTRIRRRTTNPYGKTARQREFVLRDLAEVEPLIRRTCTHEIDAAQPLADVVAQLAELGRDASPRSSSVGANSTAKPRTSRIAQTTTKKEGIVPERSPEIEQVLRDTLDAMVRSDADEIGRRTSRDGCVLSIGSDPGEWAEGHDQIVRLFRESTPEGEFGVRVGLDDVKAFREGSVGWAAGHGYFEMEGRRVPVRLTAVLHQETGDWKAVQTHASIGVPNEQMLDPMFQGGG